MGGSMGWELLLAGSASRPVASGRRDRSSGLGTRSRLPPYPTIREGFPEAGAERSAHTPSRGAHVISANVHGTRTRPLRATGALPEPRSPPAPRHPL